jgi:hypothetical protein
MKNGNLSGDWIGVSLILGVTVQLANVPMGDSGVFPTPI